MRKNSHGKILKGKSYKEQQLNAVHKSYPKIIIIWGMGTIVGVASWLSAKSMLILIFSI